MPSYVPVQELEEHNPLVLLGHVINEFTTGLATWFSVLPTPAGPSNTVQFVGCTPPRNLALAIELLSMFLFSVSVNLFSNSK